MKYIKIKVKHLLVLALFIVLILNSNNLLIFGAKVIGQFKPDLEQKVMEYAKINNLYTANAKLENLLENTNSFIYNPVVIEGGSTASGVRIRVKDAMEVLEQFNKFSEKESSNSLFSTYSKNVSLILWFAGLSDEAIDVINTINYETLSEKETEELSLIKAGYNLSLSLFDNALANLEKADKYYPLLREDLIYLTNMLKNDSHITYKNYDVPNKPYYFDDKSSFYKYFQTIEPMIYKYANEPFDLDEEHLITGYLTNNGEPIVGAVVYLDDDPDGMSSTISSPYMAITDSKGYYEIKTYKHNENYIGLCIPWHLIKDKQITSFWNNGPIEFNTTDTFKKNFAFNDGVYFKEVRIENNMLYYEIVDPLVSDERSYSINVSYEDPKYDINGSSYDKLITTLNMKGSIPLDDLKMSMSIPYANSGGMDDFKLINFLEPLYLSSNYIFRVRPSTNDTSCFIRNGFFSDDLSTSCYVEANELSEGDHLIDNGKIEEAKNWYEENISPHSLKILTAFYHKGYIESEEKFAYYHGGQDLEKAILYQEKLLELDPDNQGFLSMLSYFYQKNNNYKQQYELIQKQLTFDPNNIYINMELGGNLIAQGKFLEGLDYYLQYGDTPTNRVRYYNYLILSNKISLMTDDYQELFKLVDTSDFEPLFEFMIKGQYKEAEDFLHSQKPSELNTFYTLLFDDSFNRINGDLYGHDCIEYYVNKTSSLKIGPLKQILKKIKKQNNWF